MSISNDYSVSNSCERGVSKKSLFIFPLTGCNILVLFILCRLSNTLNSFVNCINSNAWFLPNSKLLSFSLTWWHMTSVSCFAWWLLVWAGENCSWTLLFDYLLCGWHYWSSLHGVKISLPVLTSDCYKTKCMYCTMKWWRITVQIPTDTTLTSSVRWLQFRMMVESMGEHGVWCTMMISGNQLRCHSMMDCI